MIFNLFIYKFYIKKIEIIYIKRLKANDNYR